MKVHIDMELVYVQRKLAKHGIGLCLIITLLLVVKSALIK